MATILGKMVTYDLWMPDDPLITLSHEVTSQIKNLISPFWKTIPYAQKTFDLIYFRNYDATFSISTEAEVKSKSVNV